MYVLTAKLIYEEIERIREKIRTVTIANYYPYYKNPEYKRLELESLDDDLKGLQKDILNG